MIRVVFQLEDVVIEGEVRLTPNRDPDTGEPLPDGQSGFHTLIRYRTEQDIIDHRAAGGQDDTCPHKGVHEVGELTHVEMGALLGLAAGLGKGDEALVNKLYDIIEPRLTSCPPEARPIP